MTIDVQELSKEQLRKSKTWLRYADISGICLGCKEHADILDGCCGIGIAFEGGTEHYGDLWDQIEEELKTVGAGEAARLK